MVSSLWTAASGMIGQQSSIDTISNNLANVNTSGFKKVRADFEDLIYQTTQIAGTPATEDTVVPVPIQMGHGVKLAATQRDFGQGALQNTENISDMAIEGDGFFRVMTYDGSYAYTRDGAFKIDANGQFVTSDGYKVMPELTLPQGFIPDTLAISQDGRVTVKVPGQDNPIQVGQLELYRFPNPVAHRRRRRPLQAFQRLRQPHRGTPRIRRHGQDYPQVPRDVQRLRRPRDGEHDRRPARLRVQLQGHPDQRQHARHRDQPEEVDMKCKSTRPCFNTTTSPSESPRARPRSIATRASRARGPASRMASHVDKKSKLYEQCQEFESIFVKMMLKEMRNSVDKSDSLLSGGWAEDIYSDMLDDEYSKSMAKTAGFGLSDQLYKQLAQA